MALARIHRAVAHSQATPWRLAPYYLFSWRVPSRPRFLPNSRLLVLALVPLRSSQALVLLLRH